jgi:hypothetical protein
MADEPMMYWVWLSCEVGDEDDIAERLWRSFSDGRTLAAMPTGIRLDDGRVTVEFERLSERGEIEEQGLTEYAPGSALVAALLRYEREHTLLVPLLRALVSFSAARKRAGLPPRHGVELRVVPAQPLPQESLPIGLFDAVPPPASAIARRRRARWGRLSRLGERRQLDELRVRRQRLGLELGRTRSSAPSFRSPRATRR